MRTKEKGNRKKQQAERQKVIEHLENDVEELRRWSDNGESDSELERLRQQVAELRREFYAHLGPWHRTESLLVPRDLRALPDPHATPVGDLVVRLAALLHDVGKPRTKDGPHFYRHEIVGAEMAREARGSVKMTSSARGKSWPATTSTALSRSAP